MSALPTSDLPDGALFLAHRDRCTGCGLPERWCLCAELPTVRSATRVLVVRHATERRKASNTGGLVARVLGGRPVDFGLRGQPLDLTGHLGESPRLLLPNGSPRVDAPPSTLVVLDGSWQQVRSMRTRIPPLPEVPLLTLPPGPPRRRMRLQGLPEGRSTMEAVADALELLGEPGPAEVLRELYDELARRWLFLRQSPL